MGQKNIIIGKKKIDVVKTCWNTRIQCIGRVRTANMLYKGVVIGTISEESNDAGETDWVIKVDWSNWEMVGRPHISGILEDLRLDEYVRTYLPAFVNERTLPDNRDGLHEELLKLGMNCNDRFEFMCRTHGICGPSRITVERSE